MWDIQYNYIKMNTLRGVYTTQEIESMNFTTYSSFGKTAMYPCLSHTYSMHMYWYNEGVRMKELKITFANEAAHGCLTTVNHLTSSTTSYEPCKDQRTPNDEQ